MYDNHYGIDISAPLGTTIYAAAPGTVVAATYKDGYGNYVRIRHANGQETLYAHASKLAVKTGQKVSRGTVVGYVGNTGGLMVITSTLVSIKTAQHLLRSSAVILLQVQLLITL